MSNLPGVKKRLILKPVSKRGKNSAVRKEKKNVHDNGSLPSNTSSDCTVCGYHQNCLPVDKEDFLNVVKSIPSSTPQFNHLMVMQDRHVWLGGQVVADEVLEAGGWTDDECRYCYIEDFLEKDIHLVWLVMLAWLGRETEYRRSMACLDTHGHGMTEDLDEWIRDLIKRKKSEE